MKCFLKPVHFNDLFFVMIIWLSIYGLELLCRKAASSFSIVSTLLLETLTHALTGIGFWSFCIISLSNYESVRTHQTVLWFESCCWVSLMAIVPDMDHFISAGKFSLRAAMNLPGRPFLHWFTVYLVLFMVLASIPFLPLHLLHSVWLRKSLGFAWITFVGFTSHVLRDSQRRGLWLWPPPRWQTWCGPPVMTESTGHLVSTVPLSPFPTYVLALFCIVPVFYWTSTRRVFSWKIFAPVLAFMLPENVITPLYGRGTIEL